VHSPTLYQLQPTTEKQSTTPLLDTSKRKYKEEGRQRKEGFPGS